MAIITELIIVAIIVAISIKANALINITNNVRLNPLINIAIIAIYIIIITLTCPCQITFIAYIININYINAIIINLRGIAIILLIGIKTTILAIAIISIAITIGKRGYLKE